MMMRDRGFGVYTRKVQSRFQVRAPFTEAWLMEAHRMSGHWRKRSSVWSFDWEKYYEIARALNSIYGTHLPTEPAE